ncbi:hypothetical protein V490_01634 [Pseudogymnoascus sp. VKM F-3557]|nr:hypothetical protein V490_01634 [Pseudogymnoascus sp. VKM F-3557]
MVRKLKHHESKLLRKVDFTTYASDNNHRDAAVLRRYAIQNPSDYQNAPEARGAVAEQAARYGDPGDDIEALVCGEQRYSVCVCEEEIARRDDEAQNGGDGAGGDEDCGAGTCEGWDGGDYGSGVFGGEEYGGLCDVGGWE